MYDCVSSVAKVRVLSHNGVRKLRGYAINSVHWRATSNIQCISEEKKYIYREQMYCKLAVITSARVILLNEEEYTKGKFLKYVRLAIVRLIPTSG